MIPYSSSAKPSPLPTRAPVTGFTAEDPITTTSILVRSSRSMGSASCFLNPTPPKNTTRGLGVFSCRKKERACDLFMVCCGAFLCVLDLDVHNKGPKLVLWSKHMCDLFMVAKIFEKRESHSPDYAITRQIRRASLASQTSNPKLLLTGLFSSLRQAVCKAYFTGQQRVP